MSEQRVHVQVEDHVATVTLSRPEKHNALDAPMFEGIIAAAAEVAGTTGVRAVVLHGAGPSFCSGLDIASLMTGPVSLEDVLTRAEGQRANPVQRVCTDWIDLPVPVIAAIHGNCFGGGLQIALAQEQFKAGSDRSPRNAQGLSKSAGGGHPLPGRQGALQDRLPDAVIKLAMQ